jgi:hypothetical protein
MKKLLFLSLLLVNIFVFGQEYKYAIGPRFSWGFGIDAKMYIGKKSAIESALDIQPSGFILSGEYEYHLLAFDEDGLYWFMGGGPFLGLWGKKQHWENISEPMFIVGIIVIGGLEYNFQKKPLSLSISLEPRYNLIGIQRFWAYGGISLRYTFQAKEEEEEDL